MATITSAQSWDSNLTTTWVWGIVPVVWDKVIIANPHVVTLVGTHNWGDDTNQWIIIRGTLKASRTVSSKLTARGDIFIDALGTYDGGTELDPIPSTITHEIELNDSATMASNKWGFRTNELVTNWAGVRLWGATKTRFTDVAIAYTVTSSLILDVTDATGWKIGDVIVVESTVAQASISWNVYRAITAITGNQVTLSGSLGFVKPVGTKVMNLTSNVRVYGKQGNTFASYFSIRFVNTFVNTDVVEIGETEFFCSSYTSADIYKCGNLSITWNSVALQTKTVKRIYRPIVHNIWRVSGTTVTPVIAGWGNLINLFWNTAYRFTLEEPILSSGSHYGFTLYQGTNTEIKDLKMIRGSGIATTWYSQWPVGSNFVWGYVSWLTNLIVGTGISMWIDWMTINWCQALGQQSAYWEFYVRNCTFWLMGDYGASNSANWGNGAYWPMLFENNTFLSTGGNAYTYNRGSTNLSGVTANFYYFIRNKNNDVTIQERYVRWGKQERDNSLYSNSLSSLRLDSWYSTTPNVYSYKVNALANQTMRILGKCQYDTDYGTTYPATLTISGNGITPVTFTCPTTGANVWHPIDLTVTNPNSYPGDFTLTFSGQSNANTETASVWFSGITIPDFVTVSRHYGFQFLNLPYQTVNPYITVTNETTVWAYTGIVINHGTNTITLSSPHSIEELYDYVYWDLTQNANLAEPEYFTTTDGSTFNTTYNIVNNSSLTGTGNIITSGTYTWSGTTTLNVTDSTWVFTRINVTNLVANSRVRVNNEDDNIEIYNAVVTGTSVSIPVKWTTDKALDVRVTNVQWLTAYLPYQVAGTFTNIWASFQVSQVIDTVYNNIWIDGSTVTKFSTDYPNLQIDFSTSGTITWQEMYAWYRYQEDGDQWIIYYFNACTSDDGVNFRINTNVVDLYMDNTSGANIMVVGGYLYRSDGTNWVYPLTAHSIIPFYDRAYVANGGGSSTMSWNDLIQDYSSIVGSFGHKFSQYWGVSHVVERNSFDEEGKKKFKEIEEQLNWIKLLIDKINSTPIKDIETLIKQLASTSNWKTTVVKTVDANSEFTAWMVAELLPELLKKLEELDWVDEVKKTYEELIKYLEKREAEYESLIDSFIKENN